MNTFLNDYNDLCHEKIWEKLSTLMTEANVGYGFDKHCENARQLIKDRLNNQDVDVHFVPGGTLANVLGMVNILKRHESIIAPETGHIVNHEVGSIEAMGHKINTIKTEDGKLTGKLVAEKFEEFGDFHGVLPKMVYISNTTETGTVYTKAEIEDIYKVCLEKGLYLYIDGARMAAALASKDCDIKFEDMPNLCDAFSIGGTKNGAVYGEGLVFVAEELKENFIFFMKQNGVLMSKGYVLGAQFEAFFEDDLYFKLGEQSHAMAELLIEELKKLNVEFYIKPQTNQVFITLDREIIKKLEENNSFEFEAKVDEKRDAIRLVTCYRTRKEEVLGFIEDLKKYL